MATLNKIKKGQTVTEQIDVINENVENINVDLEKVVNNEAGYITDDAIPVKSVNSKTGDVSLSAKDVGAFPNSSSIRELDINNIKDTGIYIGTYATNPYYLIVIKYNDTNIYQELIGAKFKEYRRFTGTWSEWIKEYSTENPVKASDIKGIEIVDTDKELSLALLEDTTFVKADIKYNPSSKSLYIGDKKFATEQFVRDAVNMIKSIIVAELPETGIENTIYFVPGTNAEESNVFNEYIYVNGEWEIVGGTSIDLTPFLPREEAEETYAKISSLDEKVSKATTINGKTLYSNITLTAEDVGALSKDTILVEDVVYRHTNEEISGKLTAGAFVENDLVIAIDDGTYFKGHMYKYNSGTLTDITDIITDYVDLNSDQNINGTKNFNGILRYGGVNVLTEDDLVDYVTKTGFTMRASSTAGKFYYNTGAGEKSISVKMAVTSVNGQTGAVNIEVPDISDLATKDEIPDTSLFLPKTGGVMSGDIDWNNSSAWLKPYLLAFKNADTSQSPTYPYTGFYQWGNEWQVNARDANNTYAKNLMSINLDTAVATFGARPTVNGANIALQSDIPNTSDFAKTSDLNNYVKNNANQTIKGNSSDTPLILESATTSSFIGFKRNGDTAVWGYFGVNASRKPTFYATKDEELALKSDLGTQATFSLSGTTLTITPK